MRTASAAGGGVGGKSRLSFSPDGARHQQQQEASSRRSRSNSNGDESEHDSAAQPCACDHPLLDAAQLGDDDDDSGPAIIRAPAALSHKPSLSAAAAAAAAGVEASSAIQHLMPNLLLPEEELLAECLRASSFPSGRHNATGSSFSGSRLAPCSPGASAAGAVLIDRLLPPTPGGGCCHSNLRVVSVKHAAALQQQEASPHAARHAGFSSSGSSSSGSHEGRNLLEEQDHLVHPSQRLAASPAAVDSRTGSHSCTGSRHSMCSARSAGSAEAPAGHHAEDREEDAEASLLADMGICLGNLQAAARLARTADDGNRAGGAVKWGRQSLPGGWDTPQQQQQQQHVRQTSAADAGGNSSNACRPSTAPLTVGRGGSHDGVVLLTVGIAAAQQAASQRGASAAAASAAAAAGSSAADALRLNLLKSSAAAAAGLQQQPARPAPSAAGIISRNKGGGVLHWLRQLMHGGGSRADGEQQQSTQQQQQQATAELSPTPVERISIISRITRSSDVGDEPGASPETVVSTCQGKTTGNDTGKCGTGSSSCQPALLPRPPQKPQQQPPPHRVASARVAGRQQPTQFELQAGHCSCWMDVYFQLDGESVGLAVPGAVGMTNLTASRRQQLCGSEVHEGKGV